MQILRRKSKLLHRRFLRRTVDFANAEFSGGTVDFSGLEGGHIRQNSLGQTRRRLRRGTPFTGSCLISRHEIRPGHRRPAIRIACPAGGRRAESAYRTGL